MARSTQTSVLQNSEKKTWKWVSGTRGPSQIRTDLTDPTHGPDGSIRIGELRT